jgi:hypothetical protein
VNRVNTFVKGSGSSLANVSDYNHKNIEKLNDIMTSIPFYRDVFRNDIEMFSLSTIKIMGELMSTACQGRLSLVFII